MLILEDLSAEAPNTNAFYWNLKEHSDDDKKAVLMYGYNACDNERLFEACRQYERKVYFNNWAPCEFAQARVGGYDALRREERFDEVYSICPYTNEWLNTLGLSRVYRDIFYPFHVDLVPLPQYKRYDVIYHGGIHGTEHLDCLQVMQDFNYRYCTMTEHINNLTTRCLSYATNVNLSFRSKISLVAQTKVSVCYNLVHLSPEHLPVITSYDNWQNNEAFSEVGSWNVMPQFKTRIHEAAISRTLNLVQRDNWNVVERYYEPDKEFIYFNDKDDLKKKIQEIVNDWGAYEEIVENAFKKSMNYTTINFLERIKNAA